MRVPVLSKQHTSTCAGKWWVVGTLLFRERVSMSIMSKQSKQHQKLRKLPSGASGAYLACCVQSLTQSLSALLQLSGRQDWLGEGWDAARASAKQRQVQSKVLWLQARMPVLSKQRTSARAGNGAKSGVFFA